MYLGSGDPSFLATVALFGLRDCPGDFSITDGAFVRVVTCCSVIDRLSLDDQRQRKRQMTPVSRTMSIIVLFFTVAVDYRLALSGRIQGPNPNSACRSTRDESIRERFHAQRRLNASRP